MNSFVDLRAFAAESANSAPANGNSYQTGRRLLPLPAGPISVAAIDLGGQGRVVGLDADEFIIVVNGNFTAVGSDSSMTLEAGRSGVIPKGSSFDWRASAHSRCLIMRHESDLPGTGGLLPIDESAALAPSGAPLAELLIGPTPSCRNHTDYQSASGEFVCGVWDSTPYHRSTMPYRHYELMHLLQGAVTITDEAGRSATFSKGDIFLVEQGASCSWFSQEHVAKVYAIYRPA